MDASYFKFNFKCLDIQCQKCSIILHPILVPDLILSVDFYLADFFVVCNIRVFLMIIVLVVSIGSIRSQGSDYCMCLQNALEAFCKCQSV